MKYEIKSENWKRIEDYAKKFLMMPDPERIELMQKTLDLCDNLKEKAILVFFYIYGLRPAELIELKKSNFSIKGSDLWVWLPTKKHGRERIIVLSLKDTPFLDIIVQFLDTIPIVEWRLFKEWTDPTNFNKVLEKIEQRYFEKYGEEICLAPYVFRKFRESYIWSLGASTQELLGWKGGKSIKVVEDAYTLLKPVVRFKKSIK